LSRQHDAAVVGAGPNGLAAAIALARAGRSVVVYEAAPRVGGGARSEELTLPGFRHDPCSAIHPMAAASPFLRSLPLKEHGLEWVQPAAPLAHPFDDGSAAVLERSLADTAASLPGDEGRYPGWMRPFAEGWEGLVADVMGPLGWPGRPLLLARFGLRALRSATGLARAAFRGEAARALFAGLAGHSVLSLDRMPSAAIGLVLAAAGHAVGWPLPRGGSQAISDAMASLLRSLGGEIRTGVRVRRLAELPARGPLLFDVSPPELLRIAGDALPPGYRCRLRRYRFGPGVFKLDWALCGPIPWRASACARAGTVHLGGTLAEIAASERAVWRGQHPERPYVLVAQQSLFDPSRAPAGRHTGWAYCHVPPGSTRDMSGAIEAQLERFAPGFRDLVLARRATTCADLERGNPNYVGGDINGGVADLRQLFFRPAPRLVPYRTPNPRILLCSASTPPGGGVHGMCGFHAARAALAKDT
jgi:phytoene dehydrogenase-like protein